MNNNLYLLKRFGYNLIWKFKLLSWKFIKKTKGTDCVNSSFSIGIVTYVDRYELFFKPLLSQIATLFPDTKIVVAVNGYHDEGIQNDYLQKLNRFLSDYPNVKIVQFQKPQSLSKLWNLLILNSNASKTFIFNDDIKLSPKFRTHLDNSGVLFEDIGLINRSWSHFLISKTIVEKIGWFDERFPAVGNEDEDYEARLKIAGILIKSYKVSSLQNVIFKTKNFSWKEADVVNKKYVRANQVFFDSKWDVKDQPCPGYTFVEIIGKYVKLKSGMETPQFHKGTSLGRENVV